jgi:hypothetical protein
MKDDRYINRLETVIKGMLSPLRDIPFNIVIEAMTGKKVLSFDFKNPNHKELLALLERASQTAGQTVNDRGIRRPRPNEVGNDIEPFVRSALNSLGLKADVPIGPSGNKKSTGYPDVLFWFNKNPYYLECKTYNRENVSTTQRSFYFSPSDEFKVTHDAPHFLLSYEIYVDGEEGHNHIYKCRHYKILSIEALSLDVKYEFNSDNKRMYSGKDGTVLLAEGDVR